MARILVFGHGPMRWEESAQLFALPLRSWHFARTLAAVGHDVTLFAIRLGAYEGWPADKLTRGRRDGVDVLNVSEHLFHDRPAEAWRLVRDADPTCVVAVNTYPASIAVNFVGALPFWADLNGDPMAEAQGKSSRYGDDSVLIGFQRVFVPVLRRGDRFSTCSDRQRLALIGQLGLYGRLTSKNDGYVFAHSVPNALDDEEIRSFGALERPVREPRDPFTLLWSGGYNTWADADTLHAALLLAMKEESAIRYVSLGGTIRGHDERTFETFKKRALASRFASRFSFPGWVPSSELPSHYRAADAAILVDRYTAEGLLGARTRVLDWMASGIPVVMTDLSEIAQELGRRGVAKTVPCQDPEALAAAIVDLVREPDAARAMGLKGRKYVRENFSATKVLEPLVDWARSPSRAPDRDHFVPHPEVVSTAAEIRKNLTEFKFRLRDRGLKTALLDTGAFAKRKAKAEMKRLLDRYLPSGSLPPVLPAGSDPAFAEPPRRTGVEWRAKLASTRKRRPRIGVLLVVPPTTEPDVFAWTVEHVARQYYPDWRMIVPLMPGASDGLRERIHEKMRFFRENRLSTMLLEGPEIADADAIRHDWLSDTDYVSVVGAGDLLHPDAFAELVEVAKDRDADVVYADESEVDETNVPRRPFYKPGWSPDFFLACPYVGQPAIVRTTLARASQGMRLGAPSRAIEHDLLLRVSEKARRIEHVSLVLCRRWTPLRLPHAIRIEQERVTYEEQERSIERALWRRKVSAVVERGPRPGSFRIRYAIRGKPKVSVVIPTRDRLDLLEPCVESLESLTTWPNLEVILIDNGSRDEATLRYLARSPHRVIRIDEPFNFSRLNNQAAKKAKGEYLVLLNNDTKVIAPDWIEAMLEHCQRDEVGAVGAKLLLADGTIQHAGIVYMPTRFTYAHGRYRDAGQDGFTDVVRNFSAVTAACMMMRRARYLELRGLDERFAVAYNDVDLCLRLRRAGYLVVYTPHAVLYHQESSSRGFGKQPATDDQLLQKRWLDTLEPDPYLGALGLSEDQPGAA